jgi:hypothetical protein
MTTKKTKTPKTNPSRPKPPNPRDLANLQRGMLLGTHLAIVEADHPELDSKGIAVPPSVAATGAASRHERGRARRHVPAVSS